MAFWQIAVVAFVEGTGSVFFNTAHAGALRAVVPRQQLPAAVGVIRARSATVMLAGPPLGGALFTLGRAVPFVFDAVSYAFSFLSLVLMRTPFQEEREVDPARLRTQLVEGFRFLWSQPFLRTCAFLYGLGNFTIPGILLVVVVAGQEHGLSSGGIGVLVAAFGACILLGSLLSPIFRRRLSVRAILLLELWAGLGIVAFVLWPNVYVLTAAIMLQGITLPVTDSVVEGYRIAVTPDRLLGRVESARSTISLLAAPLGPLVAGVLLDVVVGSGHSRLLRRLHAGARALGHAEPVDPQGTEPRRARCPANADCALALRQQLLQLVEERAVAAFQALEVRPHRGSRSG